MMNKTFHFIKSYLVFFLKSKLCFKIYYSFASYDNTLSHGSLLVYCFFLALPLLTFLETLLFSKLMHLTLPKVQRVNTIGLRIHVTI